MDNSAPQGTIYNLVFTQHAILRIFICLGFGNKEIMMTHFAFALAFCSGVDGG